MTGHAPSAPRLVAAAAAALLCAIVGAPLAGCRTELMPTPVGFDAGGGDPFVATPAPAAEKTPSAPGNDAVPNFKKKIQYEIVRGDAKAKLQLRREREAEQKRLAEERKRAAEDAKRMTKEEFDRAQRAKGGTAKGAPAVVAIWKAVGAKNKNDVAIEKLPEVLALAKQALGE